jgi:hypothetical protein
MRTVPLPQYVLDPLAFVEASPAAALDPAELVLLAEVIGAPVSYCFASTFRMRGKAKQEFAKTLRVYQGVE